MFIAFICLERFSKFPALCMGRLGFVSAWLGSKQYALALLLWCRRNDSAVGVHRACEQWHVGHQQTCLQSKSEPQLGWGGAGAFPAPLFITSLQIHSTGLQRFLWVPLPVALSSVPPECLISALCVLLCLLVCEQSHRLQCS